MTGLFIANAAAGKTPGINVPLWLACVLLSIAAIGGNACGYWIGYKAGPSLFHRPESKLLKPEYIEKTHEFFDKYGVRAIVLARFVPVVRTFITAMAGVGRMPFRTFITFSALGGVIWAAGLTILGYFLGQITFIQKNIELIAILIIVISLIPAAIEWMRARKEERGAAA